MSWIEEISYENAKGRLKKLYDRIKGPNNNVDNVMSIHSLRPHSMVGHMTLYKNILHHSANQLPKWYLELVGVYVSQLNACDYCVQHHSQGLRRLLADDDRHKQLVHGIKTGKLDTDSYLNNKFASGVRYAYKLTLTPANIEESDVQNLRKNAFTDGEILELNQVISYFCYANRTVLGLGVNTEGDILGLSPNNSSDEESWGHI